MKIKASEATGAVLDWLVAKCEGIAIEDGFRLTDDDRYSIIKSEGITVREGNPLYFPKGNENGDLYEPLWVAGKMHGQTPLIAAMRYYVVSKLGVEVEVPDDLRGAE